MKGLFYILALLLVFSSCADEIKKDPIPIENLKISIRKKIKLSLDAAYLNEIGINQIAGDLLTEFYKSKSYKPRWINDSTLTEEGAKLKKILSFKLQFGIPETRYNSLKWHKTSFLQDELLITATLAYLANDLQNGFLEKDTLLMKPLGLISLDRLKEITQFKNDTLTVQRQIVRFGPLDTNYQFIANGLLEYSSHYKLDTATFKIESIKNDSLFAEEKTRKSLFSKGYLSNENPDSITFISALKLFQEHNGLKPDGKIGNYTAIALSESTKNKLMRAAISMEKWRWKLDYPEKYVQINIPEYLLRLYMEDTLRSVKHIIVGKVENKTPELESKIRQIVIYPYWVVPQSITSKEILPKVKQNVNYLAKNNYKIFRKDIEVDPKTVKWDKVKDNTFPYKVRQEYGPNNSLGIIKFEFHNKYSVYIHDTPNRGLFANDIRSYSHGCMRLQDPVELAKMVLDKDSIHKKRNELTSLSMDSLFIVGENYKINLRDPIPIFVEYKTVTATRDAFVFHPDIYLRDEKYIQLMEK